MNKYTINSIDPLTSAIYVHFEYNGHILEHTSFADVTDSQAVQTQVQSDYNDFTIQMDAIDAKQSIQLPKDVEALIGETFDVVINTHMVTLEQPVQANPVAIKPQIQDPIA